MEKKNILFVCYGLGIGGIEKCLVNLINALPEEKFNIDILLMNPEYDLQPDIKRNVHFLDSFQFIMNTTDTMSYIQKHGGIFKNPIKTVQYVLFRLAVKCNRKCWKIFDAPKGKYDVAIAYSQNDYSPYYVIDKICANRKVLWYHNGAYEATKEKFLRDKIYYSKFDYVVAVSTDCAAVLQSQFGFDKEKLVILRNICDVNTIKIKAQGCMQSEFQKDSVHIVTVGRMTKEKGANLALDACRRLLSEGYKVCWHWVGYGNQYDYILQKVKALGLEGKFILEGNQVNPYPYMAEADIYVQPSFYEAYSTTVTEARVLGKAIVTTDVGGMRDQIINEFNGLIVSIDSVAIANGVKRLIDNKDFRHSIERRAQDSKFDAEFVLSQYYKTVLR